MEQTTSEYATNMPRICWLERSEKFFATGLAIFHTYPFNLGPDIEALLHSNVRQLVEKASKSWVRVSLSIPWRAVFLIRFVPFPKVGIIGDVVFEMLYVAENLIFSYWFR